MRRLRKRAASGFQELLSAWRVRRLSKMSCRMLQDMPNDDRRLVSPQDTPNDDRRLVSPQDMPNDDRRLVSTHSGQQSIVAVLVLGLVSIV